MTTLIMISSDNSIIINAAGQDQPQLYKHRNSRFDDYSSSTGSSGFNGSTSSSGSGTSGSGTSGSGTSGISGGSSLIDPAKCSPSKSSVSSQESVGYAAGTPDSSFLTPRPIGPARRTENQSLDPLKGHIREEYIDPMRGMKRDESLDPLRGVKREEIYNTDSDWETEFNVSSAGSTLSSRTSGVSSGGGSCDVPESNRSRVQLGWREPPDISPELVAQRKYTTLTKPKTQLSVHRVSRNHSFQYPINPHRFIQSENSAFKVPAAPKFLQKESHPNKFLTSTPIRESAMGLRFVGRPKANLKLNRHSSYISSPGDRLKGLVRGGVQDLLRGGGGGQDLLRGAGDGQQVVRGGGGGQEVVRGGGGGQAVLRGGAGVQEIVMGGGGGKGPVRGGQEIVPGGGSRQAPTRGGNGRRNLSPQSGPHGSKLFFNSSGGIDIKPLNYHTARSSLDPQEAHYNTRSLGRRGKLEMREVRGKEENNYCTLRRHSSRASVSPTDKSSSSQASLASALSLTSQGSSLAPEPETRVDLSPMNRNYSKIYSEPDLSSTFSSASSNYTSVYNKEDINNYSPVYNQDSRLKPIGSVFPSGCHRHPPSRFSHLADFNALNAELNLRPPVRRPSVSTDLRSSDGSSLGDCSSCRSGSVRTLSHDSGLVKETTSDIVSLSEESDSVYRSKSCDRLRNGPKVHSLDRSEGGSSGSRRRGLNLNLSGMGRTKLAGLVGSGSRILRRHTTYIKNSGDDQAKLQSHVHSWHKQDGTGVELRTSSLKRTIIRRAPSTYRLSQLFKKEEGDISVTDAQSLDRLSIQTQDEDENVVRGRVGDWAKDFDNLLTDKYGLYKFTEFLKKEFSHENIYFWCSCEKYRLISDGVDRLGAARGILERHLAPGAIDPVNLDAATGLKLVSEPLTAPPPSDLFLSAQNQIYNLMRFDSYPRFLKSAVYTDCVRREMTGVSLNDVELSSFNNELPLRNDSGPILRHRKHKDREKNRLSVFLETLGRREADDSFAAEVKPEVECTLTRVILPNGSTSVVNTTSGESIRALVSRLLEKRGLRLTTFEVFSSCGEKQFDLSEDCDVLGCTEVRVEQRVSFKLGIPGHRNLGVKTKVYKRIGEVLAPLLKQYNWEISACVVLTEEGGVVDLNDDVVTIDNKKIVVRASREGAGTPAKEVPTDPEISLYEGLQIMRKGRLEDQRGTEIRFEIPDFLKIPGQVNRNNNHRETMSRDNFNDSSPTLGFV